MLTNDMVEGFVTLAGDDYAWEGVRGCSRPPSSYMGVKGFRAILREWLAAQQGGICPQCGNALDNTAEFCHIVARGPQVRGFVPGNVFTGHAGCNASTKPQHDDSGRVVAGVAVLLPGVHIKRPDLIATEWPTYATLARS